MESEHGLTIVLETVADCLDLDRADVAPSSRLLADLGADSLDLVDLLFTLERRFGIRLRGGELDFLSRLDLSDPAVMHNGFLTERSVTDLAGWLPGLLGVEDPSRVSPADVFALITVGTLWRAVERQLAGVAAEGSEP